MKKNAVFSQKERSMRCGCVGGCAQLPASGSTHPLLNRGMVLEASSACCRIFLFCFVCRKQIPEPRNSFARGYGSSRQGDRKLGHWVGGVEGLWDSPVCPRGRCRLLAPQASGLEGGDFQDRRTQRSRHAGKSMMMTAAGSSGGRRRRGPRAAEAPPARRQSPPRLDHQGERGARAAPCSAPREGQRD